MNENLSPVARGTNAPTDSNRQQDSLAWRMVKWGTLPVLAGIGAYLLADQYTDWAAQTSKPFDRELVEFYGPKTKAAAIVIVPLIVGGLEYIAHKFYSRRNKN